MAGGDDRMEGGIGNDTYFIDTLGDTVIELAGEGHDIVYAHVSYQLAADSYVEVLSTASHGANAMIDLTGNSFNQTLVGNAGVNVLNGGGGNDTMQGLGGNDTYHVDAGDVVIEAAGGGTDTVRASTSYVLNAGAHVETLSTASQAATTAINLTGNGVSQLVVGNAGANYVNGGGGNDTLQGLGGNDSYYVDAGDVIIEDVVGGTDAVYVGASYALAPYVYVEMLSTVSLGATTAINLTGNSFNQTLVGNNGANVLHGGGGIDTLMGFGGNDIYYADVAATQVLEAAGSGNDQLYTSVSYTLTSGSEIELLSTSSHANTSTIHLTGNELANTLAGNAGINHLDGGQGADVMVGFGGNDRYRVDNVGDRVIEAAGGSNDIVLTSVSYVLAMYVEVERLETTDVAGTQAINLTGNSTGQTILGNAGANVIHGGGGVDYLSGGEGNDTCYTDVAATQIVEVSGGGTDAIYTSVSYVLESSIELLSTNSHAATTAINLTGNGFNQTLIGNAGANVLHGGGGIDVLRGLGGNDTYYTNVAATQIVESAGGGTDTLYVSFSFTLASSVFVEVLSTSHHAATAAINLTANDIANTLYGNAGENTLDGKGGNDVLVGLGADEIFAFTTALGAGNVDRMQDKQGGLDKIGLDDEIFAGLPGGTLLASAFVTGTSAQDAGDRIIYNSATGQLFFDADGSGAGAQVHFATVPAGINLVASDFIVF